MSTTNETVRCYQCRGPMRPGTTTVTVTDDDGQVIMFTNVPADVCGQCGATAIRFSTARELDRLRAEQPAPTRRTETAVYDFAALHAEAPAG